MLSVEERLRRKDELIKNGYKVERNASWGPNLNKMYMSMKAKTPKKKSWAQSVKYEGLISGTTDKMGITNPYAKVAVEFDNVFDYKTARAAEKKLRNYNDNQD